MPTRRAREGHDGFEQIAVDLDAERAALQFGQTLRDGQAQTTAFRVARAVAAHEAGHEFFCRDVQLVF